MVMELANQFSKWQCIRFDEATLNQIPPRLGTLFVNTSWLGIHTTPAWTTISFTATTFPSRHIWHSLPRGHMPGSLRLPPMPSICLHKSLLDWAFGRSQLDRTLPPRPPRKHTPPPNPVSSRRPESDRASNINGS